MHKKFNIYGIRDIGLTKLAVAAFVLFVISGCPPIREWVATVNPWYFLILSIILAVKPVMGFFK
jgi:hypothetical protein